ncbi:hypothetical protein HIM_01156 [Hirsutella minnesotensis 3608]|nr:hypothetical protein HIM_01156 [Hirsutella minnesotensis 3608]
MSNRSTIETEFYLSEGEDATTPRPSIKGEKQRETTKETIKCDRRGVLVKEGIDKAILDVLDTKFCIGHDTFTILEAAGSRFQSPQTRQPGFVVIETLQKAIAYYKLSNDKQRTLYMTLEWDFECLACKKRRPANDFQGSSYILWGDVSPPQPRLRGGPCILCRTKNRMKDNPVSLIAYSVNQP